MKDLIRLDVWETRAMNFIRDCIFDMNKEGLSNIDIANLFGITKGQVSRIRNNRPNGLSPNNIQRILDLLNNNIGQ